MFGATDVPYHYNERTNVGLLASGAVLGGATVLEEFHCTKGGPDASERKGRADLYVATFDWGVEIEAKQAFVNGLWSESRVVSAAGRVIEKAYSDVVLARRTYTARYACAFLPVWFPRKEHPSAKELNQLTRTLMRTEGVDIWAWSFPESARQFIDSEKDGSTSYYPGIVVGLREVR